MPDMTMTRHIFLTVIGCAIPLGVSLITQNLGLIVDFIGAYTCSFMGFIFPGALYIGAHKKEIRAILDTWDSKSTSPVSSLWGKVCSLKNFYMPALVAIWDHYPYCRNDIVVHVVRWEK